KRDPAVRPERRRGAGYAIEVLLLLRPVPDFERADIPRRALPPVTPIPPAHRRILPAAVGLSRVRVNRVDHRAPGVDVLPIARHQQRIAEADQRTRDPVPILALARHRI